MTNPVSVHSIVFNDSKSSKVHGADGRCPRLAISQETSRSAPTEEAQMPAMKSNKGLKACSAHSFSDVSSGATDLTSR